MHPLKVEGVSDIECGFKDRLYRELPGVENVFDSLYKFHHCDETSPGRNIFYPEFYPLENIIPFLTVSCCNERTSTFRLIQVEGILFLEVENLFLCKRIFS